MTWSCCSTHARDRGGARPAKSQLLRLTSISRARVFINEYGLSSIDYAHHDHGIDVARSHRKGERESKYALLDSHADRVARRGRLPAFPNCAGIVEGLKRPIPILDGIVYQPVSSDRVQVI